MDTTDLYAVLLGLTSPWNVVGVLVNETEERVDVQAEHEPGTRFPCPECGVLLGVYDHTPLGPGGTSTVATTAPSCMPASPELLVRNMASSKSSFPGPCLLLGLPSLLSNGPSLSSKRRTSKVLQSCCALAGTKPGASWNGRWPEVRNANAAGSFLSWGSMRRRSGLGTTTSPW
jgi:hypothetical protein